MTESSTCISRKILFVDDEVLLLQGIQRQLRREFDITVADSGEAALAILANEGPFAVVVSDYNMRGMDGIAFLNAVYQHYPNTILVMLTGRAELDIAVNALHNAHISRFLNKPCPKEILLETLNDGLEQYRLRVSEQILQNQLQQANQQLNVLNNNLEILVERKTRALQLQYRYVSSMTKMQSASDIVNALIETVADLTGLRGITLWLSPQLDGQFTRHYPSGAEISTFNIQDFSNIGITNSLAGKQIWQRNSADDASIGSFEIALFIGRPLLAVPITTNQGLLGLLNLSGDDIRFEPETLDALTGMADVTATALLSHWHREAFDDAQDAIINALAKLSEYRDPETGSHLLRLKKYSALICRFLAETDKYRGIITADFTKDLVRSSPLHDIGKVGIPDAILKKPGRLTPDEFEIMKTHAAIGGDTLRAIYEQYPSQSFIKCGMDVAYGHHEKWDGSGYPLGLQGDAIPLSARILALVDVYDALTCRRVYKQPFPRDKAKAMITENSGTHFDPDIVEAFLNNEAEFHRIAEEFADL